ncbi:unnamed protein product [Ectocarpus sp. CCAP 1310/34]|nr:unnamed protein product [Ectocarpus sp. CCAP 1310/34]
MDTAGLLARGSLVTGIEVWAGASCLNGIKVTLSDGNVFVKGRKNGPSKSLTIPRNVTVSELSLWGNGAGTRCGVGRSGWEIDCLGFAFLKPIESCKTKNVRIDVSESDAGFPIVIEQSYINHTSVPQQATIRVAESVSITTSCTEETGLEVSTNANISVGPPECNIGGGIGFKLTKTLSGSRSEKITRTIEDTLHVRIPAYRTVQARLQVMKGTFDAPYTATVYTTFRDGTSMVFDTKGRYKGTSVAQGTSSYKFV